MNASTRRSLASRERPCEGHRVDGGLKFNSQIVRFLPSTKKLLSPLHATTMRTKMEALKLQQGVKPNRLHLRILNPHLPWS